MLWKKITLDGFIPFTHVGNHHVEIDFTQPCTAILGGNGSGKSSMLREMTPYPACRTDYLKDGKIEKVLVHNGHTYVLTSDFKNTVAPHGFQCDGVQLNLSGTSDTQRDLCNEHFGINQLIMDIMSGNVHICSMQKSLRKQLFSATYPSDLSFVLEYHKKVCSQIRAYSNQIKLLQGREGSLRASLINEDECERMKNWRMTVLSVIDRIDKANLLLENEIRQLQQRDEYQQSDHGLSIETIKQKILEAVRIYQGQLIDRSKGRKLGEHPTVQNVHEKTIAYQQCLKFYKEKTDTLQSNLTSIRDELEKFVRVRDAPTSDKKDELVSELQVLEQAMHDLKKDPNWQNIPSIQQDKLQIVEDLVPDITQLITTMHPYAGKMINQEKIDKLRSECDVLSFTIANHMSERTTLEQQLAQLKSRREMMTQNSYPSDCTRICGLRATLEASVRDIDLQCREIEERLKKSDEAIRSSTTQLDTYKHQLQEISPVIPIMKRLWEKLSDNYILDLCLNGESFIDCINTHCVEIPNRIVKGIESSKIYYRFKDLFNKSEQIKNTLAMMKSNEAVNLSISVIHEMIEDRQRKLDAGIEELEHLERLTQSIDQDIASFIQVENALQTLDQFIKEARIVLNKMIINCRIEFDQKMINEHLTIKNDLSTKLRDIERTLDDQKRVTDILDTEILPTLRDLRKQKIDWELVETGLSPTKGLPCIYLVRFMNRLISRANAIIKEVWYTDMELEYIEEKETLDFSMGVIFNKSTTVKDCSLCSKGQQSIIDLAFTLAIAIERGFINWCPIICDEIDGALTEAHRTSLVNLINNLLGNGIIRQMFVVNHFAAQTGMQMCDMVVLSSDGIVIPNAYNEHAVIN